MREGREKWTCGQKWGLTGLPNDKSVTNLRLFLGQNKELPWDTNKPWPSMTHSHLNCFSVLGILSGAQKTWIEIWHKCIIYMSLNTVESLSYDFINRVDNVLLFPRGQRRGATLKNCGISRPVLISVCVGLGLADIRCYEIHIIRGGECFSSFYSRLWALVELAHVCR